MNCPNCNNKMQNKSHWYYGLGDWDMDYPDTLHKEHYCCACKIKFTNGKWTIPKKFERPSEKQMNCVAVINSVLHTDFVPLIKSQTSQFIKENIQKSKYISQQNQKYKHNWINPDNVYYENDVWCEHY